MGRTIATIAVLALFSGRAAAQEHCCTESEFLSCQDGLWCTGDESCNCWGDCEPGIPRNCDDGNWCTLDRCTEDLPITPHTLGSGTCTHENVCRPCVVDDNCNDFNACTLDRCVGGTCYYSDIPCNDSEICTDDVCDPLAGCTYTWVPGCCHVDGECVDDLFCNGVEWCDEPSNDCMAGTNPCEGSGEVCWSGLCDEATDTCLLSAGWCYIGGECIPAGTRNTPTNICQECIPTTNAFAWSNSPSGSSCTADTIDCTNDVCNGSGACTHPVITDWCYIDAACWPNGTRRPGFECQACISAWSQTAWRNAPTTWACSSDTIACTTDRCNGSGSCVHPIDAGWCLFGTTCVANGTPRPGLECQWCASATSQTVWTSRALGTACTDDGHSCTSDMCDGAGACMHPVLSYAPNDTCEGSPLTLSGSGLGMTWTGSGDTFCARDDYSSTCGGAGGTDLVHYFEIPAEYETYRYRVMAGGPAGFDTVEHLYAGNAVVPPCGLAAGYIGCSGDGVPGCWSAAGGALGSDPNDSCWYNSGAQDGVTFPNGRSYVAVDSSGGGGTYQVKVDRVSQPDISSCSLPLPEIQMGGTWTGRTSDATTAWSTTLPVCVGSTSTSCLYANLYNIDHMDPPWNAVTRGYVITTDGFLTPGGFDVVTHLAANRCDGTWSWLSCDDDTYHLIAGASGWGSKHVTGPIPAGKLATLFLSGFYCWEAGNYTMTVEVDDDGDGVPNTTDGSGLLLGSTDVVGGGDGAKLVPSSPWGDHGFSYHYPNDLRGGDGGREVYYYYDNTIAGHDIPIHAFPWVRGDVWSGQPASLWDMRLWVRTSVDSNVYCDGSGWFWATAGLWYECNMWGAGSYEHVHLDGVAGSRYTIAVDAAASPPIGGWYSIELW